MDHHTRMDLGSTLFEAFTHASRKTRAAAPHLPLRPALVRVRALWAAAEVLPLLGRSLCLSLI